MSFDHRRMYEKYSISTTTSYNFAVAPPPYPAPSSNDSDSSCRYHSILRALLLTCLSLTTVCTILSELFLEYPRPLLSIMLPHVPSDVELERIKTTMTILEYYTRAHASVLAFGALVFAWYKIFVVIIKQLIKFRRYLRGSSPFSREDEESQARTTETETFIPRVYLPFLLAVIIINDSIYNRPQPIISSSQPNILAPSTDVILETIPMKLMLLLPSFLIRFGWMAIHALPVCAIEAALLFVVLYVTGRFMSPRSNSSSSSSHAFSKFSKMQDLELGLDFEAPPMYTNEATPEYLEDALVHLYYIPCGDDISCLEKDILAQHYKVGC